MKIGVLEFNQALGEVPRHTVSPTKARRLVRELKLAIELSRDTIQLVVAHSWSVIKAALKPDLPKVTPLRTFYIPEILPPPEVPGCVFKEPISALWRRDPSSTSLALRFLPVAEVVANRLATL